MVGRRDHDDGRIPSARLGRRQRRRDDPPPLPGAGAPVLAGAAPGAVRRDPAGLRGAQGPGYPREASPVPGGPKREHRRPDRGSRMSEPSPPSFADSPAGGAAEALSAEAIDRLLADFRAWLQEAPAVTEEPAPDLRVDLASV